MTTGGSAGISLTREVVQMHASRLRDRILKGECPYPDAVLEANEEFLARLGQEKTSSLQGIAKGVQDARYRAETWRTVAGGAALFGALSVGILAAVSPPVATTVVAAASGAAAVRLLFRVAGRFGDEVGRHESYARRLEAWEHHDSDAPPKVPAGTGNLKVSNLEFLAADFPQELKGFPYQEEVRAEHKQLFETLKGQGDRRLEEVKQELLEASRRPAGLPARAAALTGRVVANAAWVGGVAALAAGHPWVAAGLGGAMLGGVLLRKAAEAREEKAPEALRAARSLHYWEEAMAAVPPAKVEDIIFGRNPAPRDPDAPDPTIESSPEDVRIGNVKVPVKKSMGKVTRR